MLRVKTREAARRLSVTDNTIRNWVRNGTIRGFVDPEINGLLVDLDEARRHHQQRQRHAHYGTYGPKARITVLNGGDRA